MARDEILAFVRKNPTSHMATLEDEEPRGTVSTWSGGVRNFPC